MPGPIRSDEVTYGRNAEVAPLKDSRFVRCYRCGFMCHLDRDIHLPYGSRTGQGVTHPEVVQYDGAPDSPPVQYDGNGIAVVALSLRQEVFLESLFQYETRDDGVIWTEVSTSDVWKSYVLGGGTPGVTPWWLYTPTPSSRYWLPAGYFFSAADSLFISNFDTYAALNPTEQGGLAAWCTDGSALVAEGTWQCSPYGLGDYQEIWRAGSQLIRDAVAQYISAVRDRPVDVYDGYRNDFTVTGGCPFCGCYTYDQEEYRSTRK